MSTTTQYDPRVDYDARLKDAGASKTVYALVTPEVEKAKADCLTAMASPRHRLSAGYIEQFRDAWTGKQDGADREFFDRWVEWSKPAVDFNRTKFPFFYPTAGASEALRHLIYDYAARIYGEGHGATVPTLHVFEGEYEGFKAMAQAAGVLVVEHPRQRWRAVQLASHETFFISQPSAIDGCVWEDFNLFMHHLSAQNRTPNVVVDLTYVGAVPQTALAQPIRADAPCVRNVVFSLSKPFGVYYDRIGGVWARQEDAGLFGNRWFKNLTSLRLGSTLLYRYGVFDLPEHYAGVQAQAVAQVSEALNMALRPADVFILAQGAADQPASDSFARYLTRVKGSVPRVCLTPGMARTIGTSGPVTP